MEKLSLDAIDVCVDMTSQDLSSLNEKSHDGLTVAEWGGGEL